VKLLDFGIAKLAQPVEAGLARTMTGALLGTPHYMSPEQCEGSRVVDHRSDLYALGCVLFQMIAGRRPFEGEGVGGIIGMHLHVPPPKLRARIPHLPVELDELVDRLLAKSPDDRPQTADETATALAELDELLAALPPPARGTVDTQAPTLVERDAQTMATRPPEPVQPAKPADPTRRRAFRLLAAMFGGSLVVVLALVVFRQTDRAELVAIGSASNAGGGTGSKHTDDPPHDASSTMGGTGNSANDHGGHRREPNFHKLFVDGHYKQVLDVCIKTGTLKADMNEPCAISACEVDDRVRAADWSRRLRGSVRDRVVKRCREHNIVLAPDEPRNTAE
jgi:serine/threonine protein kinase